MKKKLMVLIMAGTLALSSSICAFAEEEDSIDLEGVEWESEETETVSGIDVKWDDFKDQIESDDMLKDGEFFEDDKVGVKYYIPANLSEKEPSDEEKEAGVQRVFINSDKAQFYIQEIEDDSIATPNDYRQKLLDQFGEDCNPGFATVNGIEGVTYMTAGSDSGDIISTFAMIKPEEGKIVEFNFTPSDEDSKYLNEFRVMLTSIQTL